MRYLTVTICLTIAVLLGSAGCTSSVDDLRITNATPNGVEVYGGRCFTPNWKRCTLTMRQRASRHCNLYGKQTIYVGLGSTKRSSFYKCVETSQTQSSPQKIEEIQQETHFQKCQKIGFTPETDRFADCVLRLMEMQSNNRPQTVIQNNTGDSSAVRALLEEQRNQRQLEGALELMKRGSEMMSPPKPKLTCKYDAFTKTTVCH